MEMDVTSSEAKQKFKAIIKEIVLNKIKSFLALDIQNQAGNARKWLSIFGHESEMKTLSDPEVILKAAECVIGYCGKEGGIYVTGMDFELLNRAKERSILVYDLEGDERYEGFGETFFSQGYMTVIWEHLNDSSLQDRGTIEKRIERLVELNKNFSKRAKLKSSIFEALMKDWLKGNIYEKGWKPPYADLLDAENSTEEDNSSLVQPLASSPEREEIKGEGDNLDGEWEKWIGKYNWNLANKIVGITQNHSRVFYAVPTPSTALGMLNCLEQHGLSVKRMSL